MNLHSRPGLRLLAKINSEEKLAEKSEPHKKGTEAKQKKTQNCRRELEQFLVVIKQDWKTYVNIYRGPEGKSCV